MLTSGRIYRPESFEPSSRPNSSARATSLSGSLPLSSSLRPGAWPSDVKLEKGRISLIAPAGQIDSRGLEVIDGKNRFALPGLIDCHVHVSGIFITELPGISDFRWLLSQIYTNHRTQLQSGVTLARDMMSVLRASLLFKSLAEDPLSGFPRIQCAGPMLTVPGG